ncbi:MAG: response regulator, partial [Deltaproteobacteria bacterium]|nr:response regulator [Deltaproteobacteria bacterium]
GLERDGAAYDRALDGLAEAARRALTVPFSAAVAGLALLVRDLARGQGKEAELTFEGTEVEIDRRVVEEMKDAFVHLVRNAVDHGLETPAAREARGKPRRGTVAVRVATLPGGKVEVTVADDGAGLEAGSIRTAAVRRGLLTAGEAADLDDAAAGELAFRSGVTTSPLVTDLSGRGLGLAIGREKAERLGGTAEVRSTAGGGAVFRIVVPLALTAFRGLLLRAGGEDFVLPLRAVERTIRVKPGDVVPVENRETLPYGGRRIAVAWLAELLGRPGGRTAGTEAALPAVVLAGGDPLALIVDEVLGEEPAVTKPLPYPLRRVRHLAGAAVLGGGRVAPVLHAPDLRRSATGAGRAAAAAAAPAARVKAVLVAEDSITSRTLLRNILESAGYRVRTAADGAEALAELRAGEFDLLVSDVEMPRMDGFALTAAVRADRRLAELPVVLVTARESREDREKGIEAGANAYLVKSSFDQSNLLEVVARLL